MDCGVYFEQQNRDCFVAIAPRNDTGFTDYLQFTRKTIIVKCAALTFIINLPKIKKYLRTISSVTIFRISLFVSSI